MFMLSKVQKIMDQGGIHFGENAIFHNLIMCNKANLLNQASFRLGNMGTVIRVAADGQDPMHMVGGYGENNPIVIHHVSGGAHRPQRRGADAKVHH